MGTTDPVEEDFLRFFANAGGTISPQIRLTQLPGQGRCCVAKEDIPDDAELFSIPRSALLNTTNSFLPTLCRRWEQEGRPVSREASSEDMSLDDIMPKDSPDWDSLEGWNPLILCMLWETWRTTPQGQTAIAELVSRYATNEDAVAVDKPSQDGWRGYLNIMPKDFSDMPMFWSQEELAELRGTSVTERIGRTEAEAEYHDAVRPFILSHAPCFFGPTASPSDYEKLLDEHYSMSHFHVQGSRMLSRSFHVKKDTARDVWAGKPVTGDGDRGDDDDDEAKSDQDSDEDEDEDEQEETSDISMVPMADMLNATYASENSRLFYYPAALTMRSTRMIRAGEQILNTYGDPPNADVLRRYGYVDSYNGADEAEIEATLLVEAVLNRNMPSDKDSDRQALMQRIAYLVSQGLEESFVLHYPFHPDTTEPYRLLMEQVTDKDIKAAMSSSFLEEDGEELLSTCRTLLMADEDFDKQVKKDKVPKPRLDGDIVDVLLEAIQIRLQSYAGGPNSREDEERLYGKDRIELSANVRKAVVVRLGEKRVLEGNAELLRRFAALQKRASADEGKSAHTDGNAANGKRKGASSSTHETKKQRR